MNNNWKIGIGAVVIFVSMLGSFAIFATRCSLPDELPLDSIATTTTEETTTTKKETITTTELVTTMTTSSETTTTTKHLMTYDILTRIDMISMLLNESDYKRLVEKDPADLTTEERTELQYYACLIFERKQLREYLSKNKSD